MEDLKNLDHNEAKKQELDMKNHSKELYEEGEAEEMKEEKKKNKEGEGIGQDHEDGKKDKKKKKDKDVGAKEKCNDPTKLRTKLEKIETKMEALAAKKEDIIFKLREAEGNSATICAGKEGEIKKD